MILKPPSVSELTPLIFVMELTHLSSEVSIYDMTYNYAKISNLQRNGMCGTGVVSPGIIPATERVAIPPDKLLLSRWNGNIQYLFTPGQSRFIPYIPTNP